MLVQFLDWLINKKAHSDPNLLFKLRFFVGTLLLFITFNILGIILSNIGILKDPFNFQLYALVLVIIVLIIKFSINFNLGSFLFITSSLLLIITTINLSGGIYSHDMKWLVFIFLLAIVFSFQGGDKLPFFSATVALIAMISFYIIEGYDGRTDFANSVQFKKNEYLVENIMFLATFSVVAFFYYLSQNRLLIEINKKSERLEAKNMELNNIKQKLEATNRDLKSYAYATSHDLKEPLRTITSFTQLLKMELNEAELSKDAKEYINYVELGSTRMNSLIEDALILSKVNNIKVNSFERIDVNILLNEVIADLSNQIKQANADIQFAGLPQLSGNRAAIKRLFQNLVSNAIKYAKKDVSPIVQIHAESNKTHHVFSIKDNGIGISKENLKSIFEPYKRMDEKREGTGLGLAICKKIVELHNGKIWVESKKSSTSVFKFTIPVT